MEPRNKSVTVLGKLIVVLFIALIVLLISFVFPVKFCLDTYPTDRGEEFYVVRFDSLKNWWILAGDREGLYDWDTVSDQAVCIEGKNFEDIVSGDLYREDMPTYFIVWGHAEIQEQYDAEYNTVSRQYVIHCTDWDVLEEVHSRNAFRMQFSNRYLTVYDYKWFDDFRKLFGAYEEF